MHKAYPNSNKKDIRIIDAFVTGVDQKLAKNTMKPRVRIQMVRL